MNTIVAWALDKLKVANPTLFLIVVALLVGCYAVLEYLSGQIMLPNWLAVVLPFLKSALVLLGLGVNSVTKPFRKSLP